MVSGSESDASTRGGGENRQPRVFTYTERFEELCPIYMAMGMSYEQFWDGDPAMATVFQKAQRLRLKQEDERLWRQGLYFYDALCCVAPALQAFRPSKPTPYPAKPYSMKERAEDGTEIDERERESKKGKIFMEVFAVHFNRKFKERQG